MLRTLASAARSAARQQGSTLSVSLQPGCMRSNAVAAAALKVDPSPAFAPEPLNGKTVHHAPAAAPKQEHSYWLMQPVYTREYVNSIVPQHKPPVKLFEKTAYHAIQGVRGLFDKLTGYHEDQSEAKWLNRFVFLETVAGVPGFVAGAIRHMSSLRSMRRDNGWIHTLLEEAENERMHLLTFLARRNPGLLFRTAVLITQGLFTPVYALCYAISPRTCHSFVGYLEEEAVKTYTKSLEKMQPGGKLESWNTTPAPEIALRYWKLPEGSTMRDVILAVRADEVAHSHVNHTFSVMKKEDPNPFSPGSPMVRSWSQQP